MLLNGIIDTFLTYNVNTINIMIIFFYQYPYYFMLHALLFYIDFSAKTKHRSKCKYKIFSLAKCMHKIHISRASQAQNFCLDVSQAHFFAQENQNENLKNKKWSMPSSKVKAKVLLDFILIPILFLTVESQVKHQTSFFDYLYLA